MSLHNYVTPEGGKVVGDLETATKRYVALRGWVDVVSWTLHNAFTSSFF